MLEKRTVGAFLMAVLLASASSAGLAEGPVEFDWRPIRDPAVQALQQLEAGKVGEYNNTMARLVTLTEEMKSLKPDAHMDTAYATLVKIQGEDDPAVAAKMLGDFITTLPAKP